MYSVLFVSVLFCFGNLFQDCKALESPRVVPKITVLPTQRSSLGEGPYYDEFRHLLYYVDSFAGDFVRLDLISGTETKIKVGGTVTIIIPYSNSLKEFIISRDNELLKLNWDTQKTELIANISSTRGTEKFNDGKCDAEGRLFIGSLTTNAFSQIVQNASSLYRLDDGNVLTKVVEGISVSNGMSWSNDPEHSTFYLNDFDKRIIYAFDYDIKDGTLSNQRALIEMANHPDFGTLGYPDGMVMDKFGFIWVALYGGGRIVRINPSTGRFDTFEKIIFENVTKVCFRNIIARVIDEIQFQRANSPTSLAFGDYKGEFGLFVTTAWNVLDGGKIHHVSFQGGEIQEFNPNA